RPADRDHLGVADRPQRHAGAVNRRDALLGRDLSARAAAHVWLDPVARSAIWTGQYGGKAVVRAGDEPAQHLQLLGHHLGPPRHRVPVGLERQGVHDGDGARVFLRGRPPAKVALAYRVDLFWLVWAHAGGSARLPRARIVYAPLRLLSDPKPVHDPELGRAAV